LSRSQKRRQQRTRAAAWKIITAQHLPIRIHKSISVRIHSEGDFLVISRAESPTPSAPTPVKLPFNAIPAGMESSTDTDAQYEEGLQQWHDQMARNWSMEIEILPEPTNL
jgi:hypothetical protein